MKKIIVATGNNGKLKEIREILSDVPLEIAGMDEYWDPVPSIAETGSTFRENAQIKADWVFGRCGIWTLADDSGLEVDALGGAPGVKSARYAGETAGSSENNKKLLAALQGVPANKRSARFRCVMVLKLTEKSCIITEGICEGSIASAPSGDGGFGYDPLFIPCGYTESFAELAQEQKNKISHRGKALYAMGDRLHDTIG